MALTPYDRHLEIRREAISRLAAMGLSVREIADRLPSLEPPIVHPDTGQPYSHVTVHNDLTELREEWRQRTRANIAEHQAKQLATLELIQKEAFTIADKKDALTTAMQAHDRLSKLVGSNAPDKVEQTVTAPEVVFRVIPLPTPETKGGEE